MSTEATMQETTTTTEGSTASETTQTTGDNVDQTSQQQTQQSGDQTQTGEGGQKQPPAAPEKYELSVEGDVAVDRVLTEKFSELAKKHGLSQDAAQEIYGQMSPLIAQRNAEVFAEAQKTWVQQATTDKEIAAGNLQENLGLAKSAFDKYGTPELAQLLDASGLGNHPEMIRWALRVARATGEDRMDGEGGSRHKAAPPPDPAKVLFPNQA